MRYVAALILIAGVLVGCGENTATNPSIDCPPTTGDGLAGYTTRAMLTQLLREAAIDARNAPVGSETESEARTSVLTFSWILTEHPNGGCWDEMGKWISEAGDALPNLMMLEIDGVHTQIVDDLISKWSS